MTSLASTTAGNRSMKVAAAMMAAAIGLALAAPAEATTWVRGRGTILPGGLVDPLTIVGPGTPTVATGQFNDGQKGFFSQADLGNGALRGSAYLNALNGGGFGSAVANPIIGETLTFFNSSGETSSWDFSFSIDGVLNTVGEIIETATDINGNTFNRYAANAAVHIFQGGTVGPFGTAESWVDALANGDELFSDSINLLPAELDDLTDLALSGTISGSLDLAPDSNSFDLVLIMGVGGNITASNPAASFDFDFTNTATFDIDSPVAFTSDSGVFLTGENRLADIAEPGTLVLLAGGLFGLAARRRRV